MLDRLSSNLLECRMDFRDNWLKNLNAVYAIELKRNDGDAVAARGAVAKAAGKGYDYIYQILEQKSKKSYPTWKIMAALEKKYGQGRPVGWTSLAPSETDQVHPTSVDQAFDVLATGLGIFENEERKLLLSAIDSYCKNPKKRTATRIFVIASVKEAIESGEPPTLVPPSEPGQNVA